MIDIAIKRLEELCLTIPPLLSKISREEFKAKPDAAKWSKQEILGHLLDSASNNHHRIVRAQFENAPRISYHNDVWNAGNHYQDLSTDHLIRFWTIYNQHLVEVIKLVPHEKLNNKVQTGDSENGTVDLQFIITDYVKHLEHHLKQLVKY